MSLRFKNQLPALNPNYVDPAGVNATRMQGFQPGVVPTPASYAAQDMQGYNPNNMYMGRVSDRAGQPGSGNGYQFDSREIDNYTAQLDSQAQQAQLREQAKQEIAQLQTRLNEINTRIAEIDKTLPGGANDNAWEIAAQRASIGDMSAYDGMVQRGATGAQSANAIDNALMDAEKLTWALKSQNDEDRAVALNQVEVALRKAERDARQTGTKLPESYYRLRSEYEKALSGNDVGNANSLVNMLKYKKEKGTLTDDDREYVEQLMQGKENSKEYETLMSFWTGSKGSTIEDQAKAKREAERIEKLFTELESKTPAQQQEYWDKKMSKKDREKLLKIASWKDGYLVRRK